MISTLWVSPVKFSPTQATNPVNVIPEAIELGILNDGNNKRTISIAPPTPVAISPSTSRKLFFEKVT